jgi:hypothetical protein
MTAAETIRLDQLDSRIRVVWRRRQTLHLIAGLLAFCRWAIPLFLIGVAIDWMIYMPALGRVGSLITLLVVSCYRAWRCGWRDLRAFDATRTALQLEAHHGDLESLLISAVQLRDDATRGGGSAVLCDLVCRQAEEAASTLHPEHAVPYHPLRRPAIITMLLAGLLSAFAVVDGPFFAAAVMRIFTPWVTVAYPTDTQITLNQTHMIVKEGDSARIEASLGGVVPDKAMIYVRTGEGRARVIDLEVAKDSCAYTIASASRDFTYRIKAGDDRSDWHTVRVIPAPRVERVKVDLTFPSYLERAPESIEALTLTVPEGTSVNWQITLDRPISAAQFLRDGKDPLTLQVDEDGRQVTFTDGVSDSRGYSFSWVEKERGFRFTSPRYYMQVASDQAPRVELTSPLANLVALLGRPLNLSARAQDDHGISSTTVAYRVNQREEQTVDLPVPIRNGQGDQPIDWDYRSALPDLKVGDTVAFAVEVSDRYPGPQGAHVVRSETRRITFLTKEEYLKQIGKKKDRLLSRVQSIYRQERAAHGVVRNLDPRDDGYMQACQLEAIRQEIVRDQLKQTTAQLQTLLDDLAANKVSDAAESESIDQVRAALIDIADTHLASAAALLRAQSGAAWGDTKPSSDPSSAARAVNTAARELGSLVLLRSIDAAQEVYAREARMLARIQASLRWHTVSTVLTESGDAVKTLAKEQDELAQWTEQLISDLQNGMRYDKRPLAVLRLIRSVKDLRSAGTAARMRQVGDLIRQGRADQAAPLQADLVRTLLNAEFSVRLSGAYSTLMRTRDEIHRLTIAQAQLRDQCVGMSPEAFVRRQVATAEAQTLIRKRLTTLLLPSVPAPRARLFDEVLPPVPPVQTLLAQADRAMANALQQIAAGQIEAVTADQHRAEQALADLVAIVDDWSVELGIQTQGLSTLVAATSERLSLIEEYEARIIDLLEKVDLAATEKKKVDNLAEPQRLLVEELVAFKQDLVKLHQDEADQDILPLLSRLGRAERAMSDAAKTLKRNSASEANEQQELAADALAEAYAIAVAQNERLGLLQDLFMFQRSVGFASSYMADIVAEQRDMIVASKAVQPQAIPGLLPVFGNLRKCLDDVAPLLSLVAARLDAGTPLVFAATDLGDAMDLLQSGDKLDAIDAQDVAAESLAKVQALIQAVQTQTGYLAEIVEFLHRSVADATMLDDQQGQLKQRAPTATVNQLRTLVEEQRALLDRAQNFGKTIESATGMPKFTEAPKQMREALGRLEAKDVPAAIESMELAKSALTENAESLFSAINMLHGLPQIEVGAQTGPELVRLIDVLAVASDHRQLFRQTQAAEPQSMKDLARQQRELESRCKKIAQTGQPHPLLVAAHRHLTAAASALESSDMDKVTRSQRSADQKLRHFIIDQALILETATEKGAVEADPGADGEGSDTESAMAAGFISDFVSGEAPKDKRTEWKVRADRDRAALNQNFARELPLEYRGLLKNYYERVAK